MSDRYTYYPTITGVTSLSENLASMSQYLQNVNLSDYPDTYNVQYSGRVRQLIQASLSILWAQQVEI